MGSEMCIRDSTCVYVLDAVILGFALRGAQPFSHWVKVALLGFAPIQIPLLGLEGVLSALLVGALARRRAELVPAWLRTSLRQAALLLLLAAGMGLRAEGGFQGLDEKVMDASAEHAGRRPAPLVDLTGGELGLALFMGGGLVAGFVLGRHWERMKSPRTHADQPAGNPLHVPRP